MTGPLARILIVALVPAGLAAQSANVRGVVRDADTGRPVHGARVALGSWLGGWTGADGRFEFSAPLGRYGPLIECPQRIGGGLAAEADSIAVAAPGSELELRLAHGADCLTPLSATGYGEFTGVLSAENGSRMLRLCDGPGYRIAIDFQSDALRQLAYQATRSDDPKKTELVLRVRGRLEGPGFFGADGSAGYLIEAEGVSFQKRTVADACRS